MTTLLPEVKANTGDDSSGAEIASGGSASKFVLPPNVIPAFDPATKTIAEVPVTVKVLVSPAEVLIGTVPQKIALGEVPPVIVTLLGF